MRRDHGEQYDVKEFYPEVVKELKNIAAEAMEDLGDDLTGNQGKPLELPGKYNKYWFLRDYYLK